MDKPEVNEDKLGADEFIDLMLRRKLTQVGKFLLSNETLMKNNFLPIDEDSFEDFDDRLSPDQLEKILNTKTVGLLFQQNAYLIKNSIIKEGTPRKLWANQPTSLLDQPGLRGLALPPPAQEV